MSTVKRHGNGFPISDDVDSMSEVRLYSSHSIDDRWQVDNRVSLDFDRVDCRQRDHQWQRTATVVRYMTWLNQ